MSPRRIQRKRVKGWRAPMCSCGCGRPARYVGRGSQWGNPFKVIPAPFSAYWRRLRSDCPFVVIDLSDSGGTLPLAMDYFRTREEAQVDAVDAFRHMLADDWLGQAEAADELGGHDLMCWCPPGTPCHVDVLLEVANQGAGR